MLRKLALASALASGLAAAAPAKAGLTANTLSPAGLADLGPAVADTGDVRVEALTVPDVARCSVAWLARGLEEPCDEALPVLSYTQSSGH